MRKNKRKPAKRAVKSGAEGSRSTLNLSGSRRPSPKAAASKLPSVAALPRDNAGGEALSSFRARSEGRFRLVCRVNGGAVDRQIDPGMTLLEFLRRDLRLTGTKQGCGEGECGACVVLVDGKAVNSCIFMAVQARSREILTIEGLKKKDGELHPLQRAFVEEGAVQCGFCTPGMIMSAEALLRKNPDPSREEISSGLSGNICRCTGYEKIFKAVEKARGMVK